MVEICARLDGIPLAIELAAARLRMMTVVQIATRLDDTFHLLTGGSRTALPRHQTLRACIDWSYNLLSSAERALLWQLSVFQGGWTLEAVEVICKTDPIAGVPPENVLEVFTQLVDRSLVVGQIKGVSMRYRLLDTIRQYAQEKLAEDGEEQAARQRHLAYFLDLALRAEASASCAGSNSMARTGESRTRQLSRRAGLGIEGGPLAELRLASALYWFWTVQGSWHLEGLHWLELGLGADTTCSGETCQADLNRPMVRGWALNVATWLLAVLFNNEIGWTVWRTESERQDVRARILKYSEEALALFRGLGESGRRGLGFALGIKPEKDPLQRKALLEKSLVILREEGDEFYSAECLDRLGNFAVDNKDYDRARSCYEQQLALRREIGDLEGIAYAHLSIGTPGISFKPFRNAKIFLEDALNDYQMIDHLKQYIASTQRLLVYNAIMLGDSDTALKYSEMVLAYARQQGDEGQFAWGILVKGVAEVQHNPVLARKLIYEATALYKKIGDKFGMIVSFERQAYLALVLDRPERAARLLSASLHCKESGEFGEPPFDRVRRDTIRSAIQTALGEQAFAKAWAEGNSMNLEQAVAYALDENE